MKKIVFLFAVLIFNINAFSQINFQKGYFINSAGIKTECLIKNAGWSNTPKQFQYKLNDSSDVLENNILFVNEFGVYDEAKYVKYTVELAAQSAVLSSSRAPEYKTTTVFLKTLIEGKATLFTYKDNDSEKFFFSIDNEIPKQLIYKKYNTTNAIGTNNYFRQQLINNLKCEAVKKSTLENLTYSKNALSKVITTYNTCLGTTSTTFKKKREKGTLFNFNIRLGANSPSYTIETNRGNIDFENKVSLRLGVESEIIFPINRNKWALIIEPAYQSFKSTATIPNSTFPEALSVASIDYKSIEFSIGIRHYFFLTQNSKLFINLGYVNDFSINSNIDVAINSFDVRPSNSLALGAGFKYDKYSLELRYITNRKLMKNLVFVDENYNSISLSFGYTLF